MGRRNVNVFLVVGLIVIIMGLGVITLPFEVEYDKTQTNGVDVYSMSVQFLNDGVVVTSGAVANDVGELITEIRVTISWVVIGNFIDWSTFIVDGSVSATQWSNMDGYLVDRLMGTKTISSTERLADGSGSATAIILLDYVDEREYWDEGAGTYKIVVDCDVNFDVRDESYHMMPTFNLIEEINFLVYNLSGVWDVQSDVGVVTASMFETPQIQSSVGWTLVIAGGLLFLVGLWPKRR